MSASDAVPSCPRCGSRDLRRSTRLLLACNQCDHRFHVDAAHEGVVHIDRVTRRGAPRLMPLLGGLCALVVIAGVGWWWTTMRTRAPTPEIVEVDVISPTRAALEGVIRSPLGDRGVIWFFEYVNTGSTRIVRPSVEVQLLDEDSRVISSRRFSIEAPDQLQPGQRCVMKVEWPNPPHFATALIQPVPPTEARLAPRMVPLLSKIQEIDDHGVLHGELRAPAGPDLRLVSLQVVGRREDGAPVAWGHADPSSRLLEEGLVVSFTARPDLKRQAMTPVRWTVEAWGLSVLSTP